MSETLPKCICDVNLRDIIAEEDHRIGKHFRDNLTGQEYRFFGVVWGKDDLYYGMAPVSESGRVQLLSCVGSIEGHLFEQTDDNPPTGDAA